MITFPLGVMLGKNPSESFGPTTMDEAVEAKTKKVRESPKAIFLADMSKATEVSGEHLQSDLYPICLGFS